MTHSTEAIGMKKGAHIAYGYNGLRNDGTSSKARTYHSSSKTNYSRIHKESKPTRVKIGHKAIANNIY